MEENQVSPLVQQEAQSPLVSTGGANVVDTDASLKRFAFLGALAKLPKTPTEDTMATIKQLQAQNEAKLNSSRGDKSVIENEVRSDEMRREVDVVRNSNIDPIASSTYLAGAFKRLTGTNYPVEAAAAETMVLAGTLEDEEADESDILPNVYEKQIELVTKRLILAEESYKQARERGVDLVSEREGLEHFITLTEFLPMLVPVINTIPLGGNVPGIEEGLGDNILPGEQVREESTYLMDLPMDEFEKLAPEAVRRTYENTFTRFIAPGFTYGWQNKLAQELLVNQFTDPASESEINVFAVADVAGLLYAPAKMGLKGISSLDVLKGLGAKKAYASLAADVLQQSSEVGAARAAENAATTVDEALSSSVVKAMDLEDGVLSGVSSSDEVTDILTTTDDLLKESKVSSLQDLNRLKPEELERAIAATVKKAEVRLNRKIRPTDVHAYNATPGTGIYTPALRIVVGTAKGGGYRGPRGLRNLYKYAESIGLTGFKVKYIDRATEVSTPPPLGRLPPEFDEVIVELPKTLRKINAARKAAGDTSKPVLYFPKAGETAQKSFEDIVNFSKTTGQSVEVLVTREGNMISAPQGQFPEGLANALGLTDDVGLAVVNPKSKFKDLNDFYRSVRTKDNQKFMLKDEGLDKVDTNVEGVKASVVRDETTREYYLTFETGVEEKTFFEAIKPKSFMGLPELGLARLFAGGRLIEDEWLYGFSALSEARRNSLVKLIKERFVPRLQAINKKERQLLNNVARTEDRQERWMTDIELQDVYTHEFGIGSDPDKFLKAHQAFRELNDIEWRLRNDALYSDLSTQGWSTVGLKEIFIGNKAPAVGKVELDIKNARPGEKVFNAEDGQMYEWADLDKADLAERKFVLVRYKDPQSLGNDNNLTHYVVAPLNKVEQAPLSRIQLGYREGGHRIYSPEVRNWIKGARYADGKLMNPITLYGGRTTEELRPLLEDLNEYVRLAEAHIKNGTASDMRSSLYQFRSTRPVLPSEEDILKMVEDGRASSKTPFEIVSDRKFPSQYSINPEAMKYVDNPGDTVYEHMRDVGRLYYSERGDEIKLDYLGNELPVLDVYEALSQSVNNITNTVAFGPYKISKMERWVEQYSDILDIKPNMSLQQIFQAPVRQDLPPGLSAKAVMAEKQRSITRRLLNWTPPQGRNLDRAWNNVLHFIENTSIGVENKQRNLRIADKFGQMVGINKGANFLKGLGFELKLGFLNVAQVPLQLATSLSIMGIDTSKTVNAFALYGFIRKFAPGTDDAKFVEFFSTPAAKAYSGYEDPQELLAMVKSLKESVGFSIVNRTYAALDDVTEGSMFNGAAGLQNTMEAMSEISRFFFYESEKANKYVAYSVAWKMVREEAPELAWDSQEFSMKVVSKAETLAHGMGQASSAAWQKGPISLMTQFWSYPIRAMEMALGTQLTYQQKLRYFLGQAVLFGSAGPPMVAFLEDQLNKVQGPQNFENAPIETAFERGFIDTALYYGTGADVLYGERAGTGRWLEDVIRESINMSRYGTVSAAEMAGGASFSIFWDAASGFGEFMQDTARLAFSKDLPPEESWRMLTTNISENARVISTWNNITKYLSAQKAGMIYSRQTNPVFGPSKAPTVLADELTPLEAVLTGLFGLTPGEQREVSTYIAIGKQRKLAIADYVSEIKAAEIRYTVAKEAGDSDAAKRALQDRAVYYQMIPDDLYTEVFDEVSRYDHTQSIAASLAKTYEKEQMANKARQQIDEELKDGE